MRVKNAQGVPRDVLCDFKDCDTQEDVLAQYLKGGRRWTDLVIDGKRYSVCPKHQTISRDDLKKLRLR